MPQISQLLLVYQSQWFWLALVLAGIFFIAGRGIVPKVEATIDARDAQIAADLAEAQRLQDEAEAAEQSWRDLINAGHAEAQAVTAKAKAKGVKDSDARVAKATQALDEQLAEAEKRISDARKAAVNELEAVAADAAQQLVAKLTGAKVDAEAARREVAGAMGNA